MFKLYLFFVLFLKVLLYKQVLSDDGSRLLKEKRKYSLIIKHYLKHFLLIFHLYRIILITNWYVHDMFFYVAIL